MSTDPVIVVGAGLSGLATALGVALRGGHAVILESSDMVGGAAAYSGGMVWVGANHVAAREGIADDFCLAEAERHLPFFLIWDEQHHRKYGLGLTPPGGEYPAEYVMQADDLVTLGARLGVDGEELTP